MTTRTKQQKKTAICESESLPDTTQYYITTGPYETYEVSDYTDAYPIGMDRLKENIIELLDEANDVRPEDIQIYRLTNLKVKSTRTVTIEEE